MARRLAPRPDAASTPPGGAARAGEPSRRALLLGATAAVASAGCTRFGLPAPGALDGEPAPDRAGVRLTTYADDGARRDGAPYPHEVHAELWLLGPDGARELVHRARHPEWMRVDLVPGRYELVVVEVSDGERARPPAGRAAKRFSVGPGELADVVLTVASFPWEAVVAVAFVVVVIVVIAVVLAGDGSPSVPGGAPRGGGGGGAPVRAWHAYPHHHHGVYFVEPAVHVIFWPVDLYVDTVIWADTDLIDRPPPPRPAGPSVASIERVDADGTVEIRFTRPIQARDLGPDTLRIHGEAGRVAVGVSWSDDRRVAWVRPLRPLAPGRWAARVLGRAVRDDAGVAIGHDVQVGFDVP